jgi:hypothetical protein
MRLPAAIAVVFAALLSAAPSAAYDRPPLLERVASVFALRSAEVRCPSIAEWVNDPIWGTASNPQRAWAYTDMVNERIVMDPSLCVGATSITDARLPAWERAVGTLTLVHEAYHLRLWKYRRNEAQVQCRAIKSFTQGAELLGASREVANDLLPFALSAHAWLVERFPVYRLRNCKLPVWELPLSPN